MIFFNLMEKNILGISLKKIEKFHELIRGLLISIHLL